MSENTKIEWATHTFNPWEGCSKVSPGCVNCYAETRNHRFGLDNWGKGKPRRRTSAAYWRQPLKWNKEAGEINKEADRIGWDDMPRPRVFCASLADWLDDEVPIGWLADLLKLIHDTPNLDWQLLTKRPENWRHRMDSAFEWIECEMASSFDRDELEAWVDGWLDCVDMPERGDTPQNIWIGVSVEDQQRANERIPELLKIPAEVRFLSVEPMLGPINFPLAAPCGYYCKCDSPDVDWPEGHRPGHGLSGIDWVIYGGESGHGSRPCNIEWIRDGVRQCREAGVKPFVKQLGSNPVDGSRMSMDSDKFPLKLKDKKGGNMEEWPADLRVREFPVVKDSLTAQKEVK